jgi:acyl-CoA synthetase (AMP-forming)/AMP-acid ligase II
MGNGNVGIPMPLTNISIFKPGTQDELGYNQIGEICKCGPGTMLGYDNAESTAKALQTHADGNAWLHMGDIGYMNEDGVIYTMTRDPAPRYGGGDLAILPMENLVADAQIPGIKDEFFVLIPDPNHTDCFLPYLFVILESGYTVKDVWEPIHDCLEPYMYPINIIPLKKRPYFHFKTNRIGLSGKLLAKYFLSPKDKTTNQA